MYPTESVHSFQALHPHHHLEHPAKGPRPAASPRSETDSSRQSAAALEKPRRPSRRRASAIADGTRAREKQGLIARSAGAGAFPGAAHDNARAEARPAGAAGAFASEGVRYTKPLAAGAGCSSASPAARARGPGSRQGDKNSRWEVVPIEIGRALKGSCA